MAYRILLAEYGCPGPALYEYVSACGPYLEEMVRSFGVCCAVVGTTEHEHDEEGKAWPRGHGSWDSDVPHSCLRKEGFLKEVSWQNWIPQVGLWPCGPHKNIFWVNWTSTPYVNQTDLKHILPHCLLSDGTKVYATTLGWQQLWKCWQDVSGSQSLFCWKCKVF